MGTYSWSLDELHITYRPATLKMHQTFQLDLSPTSSVDGEAEKRRVYIYMDIIDQHGTCDGPMWTFSLPSFMSDCLLWDQGGLEDRKGDGQTKKRRKLGRRTHLV